MMRTRIHLCLLILLSLHAIAPAQTDERTKYLGYSYKGVVPETTLPNGVKHLGGGLIGNIDADPVYGISQVEKGKTRMLWLEISTGQNAGGVTGWLVKDVLVFTNLTKQTHISFAADPAVLCRQNKKDVENLVAVGQIFSKQGTFKPTRAWIANVRTEKFEEISIKGLKCEYSAP